MDTSQIKEIYTKYRSILWPFFSGVASLVILVFVVTPQFLGYLNIRTQIGDILNESRTLGVKAQELEKIDELSSQKDLKVVFNVLPVDRDAPAVSALLKFMAEDKSGLTIIDKTYHTSQKESGQGNFQFKLSVSGKIENLKKFLAELENSPKIFHVESITVQYDKNGDLAADIPITSFYESVPAQLSAPINQEVPVLSKDEEKLLANIAQKSPIAETIISDEDKSLKDIGSFTLPSKDEDYSSVPLGKIDPFE